MADNVSDILGRWLIIEMEGSDSTVHQMVLTLETKGFISRTPGAARSIRVLLSREHLPDLQ
jgi:SOS-response transcriptional repressor LexA